MQLKIGTYAFATNTCDVKSRTEIVSAGGNQLARRITMDVSGYLIVNGQNDCSQKMAQMIAAIASYNPELILLHDDGSISAMALVNQGSLGGVIYLDGPNFDRNDGAEYTTLRSFSFSAMAEYPVTNDFRLVSFTETLSFRGGGPRTIWRESINALPQPQIVALATVYHVTQSGAAVGYLGPVTPPLPIWPGAELVDQRQITQTAPDRLGYGYSNFGCSWRYEFESAFPLIGVPNQWPPGL